LPIFRVFASSSNAFKSADAVETACGDVVIEIAVITLFSMFGEHSPAFGHTIAQKSVLARWHALTIVGLWCALSIQCSSPACQQTKSSFHILSKISSVYQGLKDSVRGRTRHVGCKGDFAHFQRSITSGQKFQDIQGAHENWN
jgi:hypothetical protein